MSALQAILMRIEKAAVKANRKFSEITLIAVSKTFNTQTILPFLKAGHRIFGENRVQEVKKKWPALRHHFPDIELHLIGPLQSNKVSEAVRLFDVIETIDRDKIAALLAQEIRRQNKSLKLYIQVNTGSESQKSGVAPHNVAHLLNQCKNYHKIYIEGLMCIPPLGENPATHFAILKKIGREVGLSRFSMGMSNDFETAIAFGATHIRIGSAIFGHRNNKKNQSLYG
jgi:hypothetical protein